MSSSSDGPPRLRPHSLAFADADFERRFREQYFRDNIGYVRAAHVIAVGAWAFFGLFAAPPRGHEQYLVIILVGGIGLTLVSLGLTFARAYPRWWQWPIIAFLLVSSALTELHRMVMGHPADWSGAASIMLILAFAYALLRLRYVHAALGGLLVILTYNVTRAVVQAPGDVGLLQPDVYLIAFAVVGTSGSYALERFARLLFLRELDVVRERERGDELLRNILPEAIVGRLKDREPGVGDGTIADGRAEVTVLFADLVGFTGEAAGLRPDELLVILDRVFALWDRSADRFGLEKIKTIGDAYMAAAGVPEPRADHVEAAAEMALDMRGHLVGLRWPSGHPISVRIGLASGPVIAGVIGRRKFAYDIWGDTVNAASRLQSAASPGTIQVSEDVYRRLLGRYVFSDPYVVELKGRGATTACTLLARSPAEGRGVLPVPSAAGP